jgi:Spy/CpxP family protein refolding chaperone
MKTIMKIRFVKISLATLGAITLIGLQTLAAPPGSDPVGEQFFSPEMLQQAAQQIALTETQQDWLRRELSKISTNAQDLQQRLQREMEALADIAKPDRIDETKLLAQLDKVLDAERALKRLHMTGLAGIKNQLTPEQQARLRVLRNQHGGFQAQLKERLEGKLKQIQAAIQQWQDNGRDPSAIGAIMEGFDPLMKQGKHSEAEALLDRALSELGVSKELRK